MVTAGAAPLSARQQQEHRVVEAVRELLDGGVHDPSIDEISRRGRMSKAIIYRHVTSKEELYLLALCSYQEELARHLAAVPETLDPLTQLEDIADKYIAFCLRYPAYLDCAAGLQRYTTAELSARVSPALLQRVTSLIGLVNNRLTQVLAAGRDTGVFTIPFDDLDTITVLIYTSAMGALAALRGAVGIRLGPTGTPERYSVDRVTAIRIMLHGLHLQLGAPPRRRDVRLEL
jgi:AcrR family transcriptional regulator